MKTLQLFEWVCVQSKEGHYKATEALLERNADVTMVTENGEYLNTFTMLLYITVWIILLRYV